MVVGYDVKVIKPFKSNSKDSTDLDYGLRGMVRKIDDDGDALIMFEGVDRKQWVRKKNFGNLVVVDQDLDLDLEELPPSEFSACEASLPIEPLEVRQPQPSRGADGHGSGLCKPCAWYWRPQGCENREHCGHCHLCPEGELKVRKKTKVAALREHATGPRLLGSNRRGGGNTPSLKLAALV